MRSWKFRFDSSGREVERVGRVFLVVREIAECRARFVEQRAQALVQQLSEEFHPIGFHRSTPRETGWRRARRAGSPVGKPSILKRWNGPCQFIFDHRPMSREGRDPNGRG
jgi:hypothetical protein